MIEEYMSERWCKDCNKTVDVAKKNYYAAIALAISAIFFSIVPFFGTVIGIPAMLVSVVWFVMTKNICNTCGGSDLEKREPLSETEEIMKKYEDSVKKDQSS